MAFPLWKYVDITAGSWLLSQLTPFQEVTATSRRAEGWGTASYQTPLFIYLFIYLAVLFLLFQAVTFKTSDLML